MYLRSWIACYRPATGKMHFEAYIGAASAKTFPLEFFFISYDFNTHIKKKFIKLYMTL